MATSPASAVTVEELTGTKRRVELVGSGLPFQGAGWAGLQNVVTQWNAGNPEATQQVLGPQEMPSSWEGEWTTTKLASSPCGFAEAGGANQTVVFPDTLVQIFELLRRGGQLLRVTWNNESLIELADGSQLPREFKVTRIGRLTEFEFNPDRMDDIHWRMTFDWAGRGEQQRKVIRSKGEDLIALSRSNIIAAAAAVAAIQAPIRTDPPNRFRLGDLEAFTNAPLALVDDFARSANAISNRFKQLGDLVIDLKELPSAIANRGLDVAINATSVAAQFADELSREGPEAQTAKAKVSNLMKTGKYFSETQDGADRVADSSIEFSATIRRKRAANSRGGGLGTSSSSAKAKPNEILAIHVPRQDDTFFSIAKKYYGEDLSAELAKVNGFPSYQIKPPRVPIVVPVRSVLDVQSKDRV